MSKYTSILIAIICFNLSFSQDDKSVSKKDIKQFEKLKAKIESSGFDLSKELKDTIGYLKFDTKVEILDIGALPIKASVDSIMMSIKEGCINDITVYTKKGVFVNKNSPIAITNQRFKDREDFLRLAGRNSTKYIICQKLITVHRLKQYIPNDDEDVRVFKLNKFTHTYTLTKNVGVNNIFDIRLYSDALALFGEEENGLVQTDLRYKYISHRKNIPNTGLFIGQYLKINFNATRFDSKDKVVDVSTFNNTQLLQKSYINADVAYNLFNGWLEFKSMSKYYVDAGIGVGQNKIKRASDTTNVSTSNFFIEGGLNLKSSTNIIVDLNARLIRQFSPSTQQDDEYLKGQYFNFARFQIDFCWHPVNNKANRIFARINYFTPTNSAEKKNDFFQAQIGYSILLSDLIK